MPWYDYRCESCAHDFEARMTVERRDEAPCPECGSTRVRRAMPAVLTIVKASAKPVAMQGCCGGAEGAGCACARAAEA